MLTLVRIALTLLGVAADSVSLADAILKRKDDKSLDDLFQRSFTRAVNRHRKDLSFYTETEDPNVVKVDKNNLKKAIAQLQSKPLAGVQLDQDNGYTKLAPFFKDCIILPGHQLTDSRVQDLVEMVIKDAFLEFAQKLPLSETATNEVLLQFVREASSSHKKHELMLKDVQSEVEKLLAFQERLAKTKSYLNPTKIQNEGSWGPLHNPFRILKAEDFEGDYDPLLASLFQEPVDYDLIRGRGNLILEGARGCGKSMILKSLSAPIAIDLERRSRKDHDLTYGDTNLDYFGVYIKITEGSFTNIQTDSIIPLEAATQLFQHAFNMQLLKGLVSTLLICSNRGYLSISSNVERTIVEAIGEKLTQDPVSSFEDLLRVANNQEDAVGEFLGRKRLGDDITYTGQTTYVHKFPDECCRIVITNISELQDSRIYFLLDEFENLFEFQQTVVNSLIKLRQTSLNVKVATRALGVKSNISLNNEPIQMLHDYEVIDLDYRPNDTRYKNLLIQISRKRLEQEKYAETDISKLLPGLDPFPELGPGHVRQLVIAHANEHGSKQWNELTPEQQQNLFQRLGQALTFRDNQARRYPKLYVGFDSYILISSGIVRSFLELCKVAFYLAETSDLNVSEGAPIIPDIQNEAAYLTSQAALDRIPRNIPGRGLKISKLITDLADVLRKKLLTHVSAPEAARISIKDTSKLEEKRYAELSEVLKDAVRWSVLHAQYTSGSYRPKHMSDLRQDEYLPNRIFAPALKISPRYRWRTEFRLTELADLIDPDQQAKRKNDLLKKHSRKKRKKSTLPQLFSEQEIDQGDNFG